MHPSFQATFQLGKLSYLEATRSYLNTHPGEGDPPSLFRDVRASVMAMARDHIRMLGSEGRG